MVPMHGQNRLVRRQLGKKLEIAPTKIGKKEAQFSKRQPHSLHLPSKAFKRCECEGECECDSVW